MRGSPRRGPPASRTRDHAVVALSMVTAGLLLLAVLRPTLPGIGEKIRWVPGRLHLSALEPVMSYLDRWRRLGQPATRAFDCS